MQNSFLCFNIVSFDFYTLLPPLFKFFYPLGKVGDFSSDENLFRPSQILKFGNKKKSEEAKSGE